MAEVATPTDLAGEGNDFARALVHRIREGSAGPDDVRTVFAFMGDGEMAQAFAAVLCEAIRGTA